LIYTLACASETGAALKEVAMQLDYALEGYWLSKKRVFSVHTIKEYEITFRRFKEFLGTKQDLSKITAQDVERFLNHLRDDRNLCLKSVLNSWIALSSFWTWAERNLEIQHVMRGKVERPRPHRRQSPPLEEAEVRAILSACSETVDWRTRNGNKATSARPSAQRDRAIILVLIDTGMRVSELVDLVMRDYDAKKAQLTIRHGKGDKKRVVYLADRAKQALWKYLAERPGVKPDDPIFASRTGTALDRAAVRKMIERLGERAGVEGATPHRFRHTFAINFLRNGGNPLELQKILGHEKLDTVKIYADLASVDIQRAQRSASPADHWRL
jgi:integrase/recombinase XerD